METDSDYQPCGPFKAPFFHPRCDEYPMYSTLAGDKPQPRIFGLNKTYVYAGLEVWPPSRVAPGEKMELAAMIKLQPPPHPRWVKTVCRMIAFSARENPLVDPVDKNADIILATQDVAWRESAELLEDIEYFLFKFQDVAFPEAGKFEIRFEVNVTEYYDQRETPLQNWPPPHLWAHNAPEEIIEGTSGEWRDRYQRTGFCAGVLVVGGVTHVDEEFRGQYFDRKSVICRNHLTT